MRFSGANPIVVSFVFSILAGMTAHASILERTISFLPKDGAVRFLAIGRPQALRIRGDGEGPSGKLKVSDKAESRLSGEINFNLESLKTGIELRDHHMKKNYLETDKNKEAQLFLNDMPINPQFLKNLPNEVKETPFKGTLRLHGVEKEVEGRFSATREEGGQIRMHADFTVKLANFGIDIPKYLGVTVADEVSIEVETRGVLN